MEKEESMKETENEIQLCRKRSGSKEKHFRTVITLGTLNSETEAQSDRVEG